MARYFIDRPVFAWVIAILISLGGVLSIRTLGVESYPTIAPPQIVVTANYSGASADTAERTVTQVIEQQLTGIDHLLYFTSQSSSNGAPSRPIARTLIRFARVTSAKMSGTDRQPSW